MKIGNLITVCLQNLSRHKARTLLTVLGIIVGYCSVVIIISIRVGMKNAQERALAQMGDLSTIQMYPTGKGAKSAKLNTRAINKIRGLRGVEAVTLRLSEENVPTTVYGGGDKRYKASYIPIVGIDLSAARAMSCKLTQRDQQSDKKDCIYTRQNFACMFEDTRRPQGRNTVDMYGGEWDDKGMPVMPPPHFDVTRTPVTMELSSGKEDGKRVVQTFKAAGRLKRDFAKGEEASMGLLVNLEVYQSFLGQQARLAGKKWDSRKGYQNALVRVKDIRGAARAELKTKKMGFGTGSMGSIREPMEQETRQKQTILGGLNAISLFVAALGITNTMIMSISERAREIGVMKSLGCFIKDVRKVFLLEAGRIGLLGGIAGSVLSYRISTIVDLAAARLPVSASIQIIDGMTDIPSRLSVIPWWLDLSAILFSVAIGVGADYYPANKAVGIPVLEAIKHD